MDTLKSFIEKKIDSIKNFLDTQHTLLKLAHQKQYYINTPKHVTITKTIEDLKLEYNKVIEEINVKFDYENDVLEKYITYIIKYEFDNPHSNLNDKMEKFTYDLHQFVNSLDNILPNCEDYVFDCEKEKTFVGLIDGKLIKILESELIKLEALEKRWLEILNEEKELKENAKTLESDAVMWRKYKHLIEQRELVANTNVV